MQPPQRRESQESGERVDLTGALPSPVLFWEICQKPINQKKEQHEFARVRARVYVYIYIYIYILHTASKRNNDTYSHIYIPRVITLFSNWMQCDLLNDNSCNGPAKFNNIIFNKTIS